MPLAVHLPHTHGSRPLRWVDPADTAPLQDPQSHSLPPASEPGTHQV